MKTTMKTAVLKRFIETVWNQGQLDAIGDFIGPAYTIQHDPGDPWDGQTLNLERFTERVALSRAPVPDQHFDIQHLAELDDAVFITWRWCGTHLGDIAGIPPSGKRLTMSGATVYRFDGERIVGHWQVADRLGIYQQLQVNHSAD